MILSFQLYDAIRVLQLQDNVSSDDNVTVELENSSLDKLEQFTLCGRFLTPYLPNMKSNIQSLIYRHSMYFMSRIELRSCEDRYSGCTRFYKDDLARVVDNWDSGNSFGHIALIDDGKYSIFPLWKPEIVKPWPQTLSPKTPKPKTKWPWADTKISWAITLPPHPTHNF